MQRPWSAYMTISALAFFAHADFTWALSDGQYPNAAAGQMIRIAQATGVTDKPEPIELSVPPQTLGSAITSFADQANYRLLVTSDMTEGMNSNGITGRHSPNRLSAHSWLAPD